MAGPRFSDPPRLAPEPDDSLAIVAPRMGLWMAVVAVVGSFSTYLASAGPPGRAASAAFDLERDLHLAQARAGDRPCRWTPDKRFACTDDPWAFIGPYGGHTAGRTRRCTWIHPIGAGVASTLHWPKVPLGSKLVASIGLVDGAGEGRPAELTVASGEVVFGQVASLSARDLHSLETKVPPGPAVGPLTITVRASDHTLRMACIDVRLYGERLPAEAIDASTPKAGQP